MHPVIWKEHDNSWTWSIEEGKAFEKDHQVLARDEGFATRGDAKEAMQIAWDRLLAGGKTPGRPGMLKPPASAQSGENQSNTANNKASASKDDKTRLEWAIVVGDDILAVFATESKARKFGRENYKGNYKLRNVTCLIRD